MQDIQDKLNKVKKLISHNQKVKMKDSEQEYLPRALRLCYTPTKEWLYSVECVEERTNSVIHIKLSDIDFERGDLVAN